MDPAAEALVAGLPEGRSWSKKEAIASGLEVRRVYAASRAGSYHHALGEPKATVSESLASSAPGWSTLPSPAPATNRRASPWSTTWRIA